MTWPRIEPQTPKTISEHSNHYANGNCMQTLHDQLNEIGGVINDKNLACNLLVSLPLNHYEVLLTSLAVQGEKNLQFERWMYLHLLSFYCEAFNDFRRKNSKANFSKSNVSDYNHQVLGKWVNGSCNKVVLNGYTDVDHAGDLDIHKFTSGCFFIGIMLVGCLDFMAYRPLQVI